MPTSTSQSSQSPQNVTSFEVHVSLSSSSAEKLKEGMNVEAQFEIGRLANAIVSAYLQSNTQVVYGEKNNAMRVYGTDLNYPVARNTFSKEGRFFSQEELKSAASVAVIAPTVQKNLFPVNINPIGQKIRIQE